LRRAYPLLVAALLSGCDGASPRSGIDALVRVQNAQFVAGAMPSETSGPKVTEVDSNNNSVRPGQQGKSLTGRLGAGATAVAIGFDGDAGYWIVPAGVEDVIVPGEFDFAARLSFSPLLPPGMRDLLLRAVDGNGGFGPIETLGLTTQSAPPDGKLVISLSWDTEADLDLHVLLPDGVTEIWAQHASSYVLPESGIPDPAGVAAAGFLDFDSNAQCVIDGRLVENVLWRKTTGMPPSGHYQVRVDAFSLCGQPEARWRVQALLDGAPLGSAATGVSLDGDTRFPHQKGAGVLALEFDVP
jgi:hypothetical protein